MRNGTRLGVDVGEVRIGVARSDPAGILATPVETVPRSWPESQDDLGRIADLVRDLGAVEVLVGLPISLSGREGPSAAKARRFADALAARLAPCPVRLVDERLSTVSAHQSLHRSGVSGKRRRKVVDQAAAVVLLQAALDTERQSGRPPGETVRIGL